MNISVRKIWNEDETNFLLANYSNEGLKFCFKKLNISKYVIFRKAKSLGLKVSEQKLRELQSKS